MFADGGGLCEPSGELQSAAVGRRRTARRRNACFTKRHRYSGSSLRSDRVRASRTIAGLRWGEAAARTVLRTAFILIYNSHASARCSPTAEGCASLRASCSPPRWGGGELRAGVTPVLRKGIDIRAAACGGSRNERMRIAGLCAPRLRPAQFCEPHFAVACVFLS